MASAIIDPRVSYLAVTVGPRPGWECWKIDYYENEEQSPNGEFQAGQAIMAIVCEKDGARAQGTRFQYGFPSYSKPDDTDVRDTDNRGRCDFALGRNSWDRVNNRGVYWIQAVPKRTQKGAPTALPTGDIVNFMGLGDDHHHHDYVLWYRYANEAPPPPIGCCTLPDGTKHATTEADCALLGGTWVNAPCEQPPEEPGTLLKAVRAHLSDIPPAAYLTVAMGMGNASFTISRVSDGCAFIVLSDGGWVLFTPKDLNG